MRRFTVPALARLGLVSRVGCGSSIVGLVSGERHVRRHAAVFVAVAVSAAAPCPASSPPDAAAN